ncbi:hypothetical protein Sjap_021210 [Stephania japonica]|uniref:RNA polymerase sigma factor n=1 Tax=Stephania japonica TaxID=461633 RepID=A0AAP0F268_9MAGN
MTTMSTTTTTMTMVVDLGKLRLPSWEDHPHCLASDRPLAYVEAIGPPIKANGEATLFDEALLTGEEAVIAAAAAEAVALAKAAVETAQDAAMMISNNPLVRGNFFSESSSTQVDRMPINDVDRYGKLGHSTLNSEVIPNKENVMHFSLNSSDTFESNDDEHKLLVDIDVKSRRRTERRAKRAKATEKASTNLISLNSGSSSRKKRAPLQVVDYSDPLRYLRGTMSSSRLLTVTEELELSEGIQDLLKLEKLHDELAERCGVQPNFAQWAAAAGVDQKVLRKRLNHGILCKDKMVKSNIRLVISIAKNYQGAGMNLQDLVQEGCRGLVKGAEKFDASKGFKFSTYAHWWIKQAVRKSLSDQSRTIRLPFHMVDATYRVREAKRQLFSENGRHPDNEEVAEATGLSMKRLTTVLLTPKAPRSLDQKIGINQNLKPSEVIADPDAETAEDLLTKKFMKQDLEKVLDSLSTREKQVVRWRFGLEDGRMKTLQEIGELMGVSRERIRQIESCAFRKLKNKKRTKNLQQYLFL